MKSIVVVMFVALCSAVSVDSESASESRNKITGPRSPIISGDMIVLRSANTDSTKWLECTNSSCGWTNCQGSANSNGRSSCSKRMMFIINGKKEGRAIVSGETVSLSSVNYGSSYRLGCSNSSSTPCGLITTTSSLGEGNWLAYSYATFQIFSRDAEDGTIAVQNGDVVGFKHPYSSNGAWLTFLGGQFYPRYCSKNSKGPCAAENKPTGFVIFKRM